MDMVIVIRVNKNTYVGKKGVLMSDSQCDRDVENNVETTLYGRDVNVITPLVTVGSVMRQCSRYRRK